jgi:hypothetical protein
MGREDEAVHAMEIDGHRQLVGAPAAVPEGFNADYLRVYYGKVVLSVQRVRAKSLRDFGLRRSSLLIHAPCWDVFLFFLFSPISRKCHSFIIVPLFQHYSILQLVRCN